MGKTIRYEDDEAKRAPRRFVISFFNERAGVWMETAEMVRQSKAETLLQRMRADNVLANIEFRR